MSTNANISVKINETEALSIYNHWDGYPSWVGKLLLENYSDPVKARALVDLGDVSVLAPSLGTAEDIALGHSFNNPREGVSVFYGRDRGEDGVDACLCSIDEVKNNPSQEYDYYFDGENWFVIGGSIDGWMLLAKAVEEGLE